MATKREHLDKRLDALRLERSSWEGPWREIGEQLLPYGYQFDRKQRNQGTRRDTAIINSRPLLARRTLDAGLMAGVTSPARVWFKSATPRPELAELPDVRAYLDEVDIVMRAALSRSNLYRALSSGLYPSLDAFGTAAMFEEEGQPREIRFSNMQLGEYWLDVNADGDVDTCFRELYWTVRQIVQKFGYERCSRTVRNAWDHSNYNLGITIFHAVFPNDEYVQGGLGAPGMAFSTCWWEQAHEDKETFLHVGGYHEFPVLAPRWSALSGDAYGRGPGWDARGDCRELQHQEKQEMVMVDKITNPPMRASGLESRASLLPADVTNITEKGSYEAAVDTAAMSRALDVLQKRKGEIEDRITEQYFGHLWNMLMQDERNQRPTATEVEAKRQEVALQMGPLLESLNEELLEKIWDRTYAILNRNDMLPIPPEELEGEEVKAEFMSIMHQMQQATGLVSIRTLMQEVQVIAQLHPDVVDKIDAEAVVDELQRITGVKSDIVRATEEVEKIRAQRAEQEQAQRQGEAMLAATQGAKNLSSADPQKLSQFGEMFSPAVAAQGGALGQVGAA